MILRTTYTGTGGGVAEDRRFYYAQNWRADVSVVLDDAGVQQERVIYSPYGQPFAMPAGDTNFDGDFEAGVDGDELADWDINGVPYRAYADVNLDGDIDGADATAASAHDLGWNVLTSGGGGASGINNRLGYAGYIHDRDVATAAHVRYRVYKIDLGRWVQKDPLNYVDGMNLYEYARTSPLVFLDHTGLAVGCGGAVGVDSLSSGSGSSDPPDTWTPLDPFIPSDIEDKELLDCIEELMDLFRTCMLGAGSPQGRAKCIREAFDALDDCGVDLDLVPGGPTYPQPKLDCHDQCFAEYAEHVIPCFGRWAWSAVRCFWQEYANLVSCLDCCVKELGSPPKPDDGYSCDEDTWETEPRPLPPPPPQKPSPIRRPEPRPDLIGGTTSWD